MKNLEMVKMISNFKTYLQEMNKKSGGVNYVAVHEFIIDLNNALGKEVIKMNIEATDKLTYSGSKIRHNDKINAGFEIDINFLGDKYIAHTSDKFQNINLLGFMLRRVNNPIDLTTTLTK